MPTKWLKEDTESLPSLRPPPERVRQELQQLLNSTDFKATPRRRKLLKYLVEELLSGRDHELKGYTIATVVFGRDESFDPQTDPVVRLEARRLRHDLDSYYVSSGRSNPLRISIPKGQYAPTIEWSQQSLPVSADETAAPSADEAIEVDGKSASGKARSKRPGIAVILASAGILLLIIAAMNALFNDWTLVTRGNVNAHGSAIAILPFTTNDSSPENVVLGRGIADQISADVSRFPDFRLYLPQASANEDKTRDPIEIGGLLGLSYVVDGRIQADTDTNNVRVSARLIDVRSHEILWIGTYDRAYSANSLITIQDEIAAAIASTLGQPYGVIRTNESNNLRDEEPLSMSSYQCVLSAYAYRRSFSSEHYKKVFECLEKAVQRDPGYAEAWAMLGWLYMDAGRFLWVQDGNVTGAYEHGLATASHALAIDRNNIAALKALGSIHHYMGNFNESVRLQRQALALNPNDPDTLAQLGWRLAVRGRFEEGIPFLQQAIERTVSPPGWYFHLVAIDHLMHRRYAQMLAAANNAAIDGSGISWSLVAIAQGALGNKPAARAALAKMGKVSPSLARDPAAAYRRHQAVDSIVNALVFGLRQAGWNESS